MSINKRQFNLLQAMGITVWQRRELSSERSTMAFDDSVNKTDQVSDSVNVVTAQLTSTPRQALTDHTTNNDTIAIDLKALLKQPLFNDIIRCLGVNSADLSINHNQIDLGFINWQFTAREHIELKHNCLTTPQLAMLANSPVLKKSLWQSIGSLSSI